MADCCEAGPLTCGDIDGLAGGVFDCDGRTAKATDTACADDACTMAECCEAAALSCGDIDGLAGGAFDCGAGDGSTKSAELCSSGDNGTCDETLCCVAGDLTCGAPDGLNGAAFACGNDVAKAPETACADACDKATCCTAAAEDDSEAGRFVPVMVGALLIA